MKYSLEFGRSMGSMLFEFHPEAEAELDAAVTYYTAIDFDLGFDFNREVSDWLERIADYPEIAEIHAGTSCRRAVLQRFPYLVFYELTDRETRILAVAHGSRAPNYWIHRLND
jgi:plasmid stabilization system protein ParE